MLAYVAVNATMQNYHAILFLLVLAIAVSAIAPKIRLPYPILLLLAGIGVGFLPGITFIPVDPDVVFLMFLPPLLYSSALNIPFRKFTQNLGSISRLAIPMVFITMSAIALVCYNMIPGITWPVAFIIGAILSPPDAIAASAIIKNMRLPDKTKIILEGESLVNDASALTAYRILMGIIAGKTFVLWQAGLEFILIICGGCLVGIATGFLLIRLLKLIHLASTPDICLNIIVPFAAYQFAENIGVSGVLAVVTIGLMLSRQLEKEQFITAETIENSKPVWDILIYILSGLVFILIGMEFPQVIHQIDSSHFIPLVIASFAVFFIALFVRILFVFEHRYRTRRHKKHKLNRQNDPATLDWKNALVIGWSGMRGIVSIATAIGLPVILADGETFPERNSIIFLTVLVVILMLVIQGIGLPLLIRTLKIDKKK